ncbi:hypothetical protein FS749_008984 [Ceratobasidium sp. UAMH 11750]|nr:hypothetical protein FS749_008984 [Ceratobasidium sp. UAMH 11750]
MPTEAFSPTDSPLQLQDGPHAIGARNLWFLNLPYFDPSPGGNYSTQMKEQMLI